MCSVQDQIWSNVILFGSINVNNTGNARRTTCRIFIAPKFDERNLAWALTDQRKMFIEMDRFVTPCKIQISVCI